ncbi:glyceraldehyde 3-phosphate dehydrogenase NAD-binding domain-containing protein, partial [Escherichia coli]
MSKVGINGFGRIGRLVLRRLLEVKSNVSVQPE